MNFFNIEQLLLLAPAFVVAIAVHEASHALAAQLLGDPGPSQAGRLTLNPLRHLDPLGTVALFFVGFGWGKPVSVQPWRFRVGAVTGMAIVAFAGPLANVVTAALFGLPLRLDMPLPDIVWAFAYFVASINVLLAVFNLIPLPPLDGFSVLMGILPSPLAQKIAPIAQYGPAALLSLFALSYVFKINLIGALISPPFRVLFPLVVGI
ncbi:MAG: site-2 protease family protein [Chloroflexota bacterium]|jgi:Zn-dependent protease